MYRKEILIRDFNKRELKVLEFVHQGTVDIQRDSVFLRPGEFQLVGISPNHIQSVMTGLLENKIMILEEKRYRINPVIQEWKIVPVEGYQEEKFRKIMRIRTKNTVPQFQAISTRESDKNSPYGKTNCQNGNPVDSNSSQNGCSGQNQISQKGNFSKEKERIKEKEISKNLNTKEYSSNTGAVQVKELLNNFKTEFQKTLSFPYCIQWGKDQKILKDLLTQYDFETCKNAIQDFFELYQKGDEFLRNSGMTIGVFKSQLNKILVQQRKEVKSNERFANQRQNIHQTENDAYFKSITERREAA